jgi:hypothetical protein
LYGLKADVPKRQRLETKSSNNTTPRYRNGC